MADEVDDHPSDNDNNPLTTGQRSQENEFGERGLDADSSPPVRDRENEARMAVESPEPTEQSGGPSERQSMQEDGMSGQPIGGNDSATGTGTTLTQGADFGAQTTSNSGGSSVGKDQTTGGSSGTAGGQGFIGSQASRSGNYLPGDANSSRGHTAPSSADANGGTDFAKEGRGAPENEDERGTS